MQMVMLARRNCCSDGLFAPPGLLHRRCGGVLQHPAHLSGPQSHPLPPHEAPVCNPDAAACHAYHMADACNTRPHNASQHCGAKAAAAGCSLPQDVTIDSPRRLLCYITTPKPFPSCEHTGFRTDCLTKQWALLPPFKHWSNAGQTVNLTGSQTTRHTNQA